MMNLCKRRSRQVWNLERLTGEVSKKVIEENRESLRLTPEQGKRWGARDTFVSSR